MAPGDRVTDPMRRARQRRTEEAVEALVHQPQSGPETFWTGFAVASGLAYAALWSTLATGGWMTLVASMVGLGLSFFGTVCTVRIAFAPVATPQRWLATVPSCGAIALLAAGWIGLNSGLLAPAAGWLVLALGTLTIGLIATFVIAWCRHNAPALALAAWQTGAPGGEDRSP